MGKTLLVTGGSRGIGEAIVRAAAGKFNVAFTYLTGKKRAEALEGEFASVGGVKAFSCDVSCPKDVERMLKEVKTRFGRIDMLVNNAGISQSKLFTELTDDDWRRILAVNLDGVFYVTRGVLPDMIAKKSGAIVNVSSVWGISGASMETHYSASKAGVIGLTKALAREVAPSGITVNALAPGAIATDMMSCYSAREIADLEEAIPAGRLGKSSEVAQAALFLLTSGYVTGQILTVDGGWN